VLDRIALGTSGAVALRRTGGGWARRDARAIGEDRPWSPAPASRPQRQPRARPGAEPGEEANGMPEAEAEPVRLP
jgi:competence protein ComEC